MPKGTIFRLPHFEAIPGQTVAEGMGHAMTFAAQREDWPVFDALFNGLSYFRKANGLLRWKINNDGTVPPGNENLNSSSEHEQNVATALLLAYQKTGKMSYKAEAVKHIQNIWREQIIDFQGRLILMPADRTDLDYWPLHLDQQGGVQMLIWNPSLDSPKRFRMFAEYDQAHDWNKVINDWYELANQVLNAATAKPESYGIAGIIPMPQYVWLVPQDKNEIGLKPFFPASDAFGSKYSDEGDTIRIPIYVGLDAASQQGRAFLERFYSRIKLTGPQEARIRLQNQPIKKQMMAIAALAAGLKVIGRDVSQYLPEIRIDEQGFAGDARGLYYDQTICYYAYLLLNDKFPY